MFVTVADVPVNTEAQTCGTGSPFMTFNGRIFTFLFVLFTTGITVFISHKVFQNRTRRILHEAESEWTSKHRLDSRCSVLIESIPSGWFNILLTSVWPSLLERFFSNLATERLERSFQRRIKNQRNKFPWRHLTQVTVEHVTLGLVPPQFEVILAKYDPTRHAVKLEADLKWATSAFQIVLGPVIQSPMIRCLKTRFLLSNLNVSGRISATLMLSQDQPGIERCEISFSDVPSIDMCITPVGMALKDFPGIPESLRATIVKLLTKEMVYPKKLNIDVRRIYDTQRMKRRGGDGGLLTLTMSSAHGFFVESTGTVEAFCECQFEKHLFRTPIRSGSQSVAWDWNCGIRLDEKISEKLDKDLRIRILGSKSLGEPTLLAHGSVSLREIGELQLNAGIVTKSVVLQSKVKAHKPVVYLTFHLTEPDQNRSAAQVVGDPGLPSVQPDAASNEGAFRSAIPATEAQSSVRFANSVSDPTLPAMPRETCHVQYDGKVEAIEEAIAHLCSRRNPAMEVPEAVSQPSYSSGSLPTQSGLMDSAPELNTKSEASFSSAECATRPQDAQQQPTEADESLNSTGFVNLLHVTKFDDTVRRDRLMYKQQLSEMQSQVSHLERQLILEQTKRHDDGIRAMIEGGRFLVHKHHERAVRHIWYDPSSNALNWSKERQHLKDSVSQLWPIKTQPLHQVSEIRTGLECFPKVTFFGLGALRSYMQKKIGGQIREDPVLVEANCLSILFVNNKALNLEIPQGGNGRGRDAWVEALQSLLRKNTDPCGSQ